MQKIFFYDQTVDSKEQVVMDKPDSSCDVLGFILGDGSSEIKLNLETLYLAPRTTAKTDFRILLKDQASCKITGMIKIGKKANKTDAYLTIKSLLLSDQAKIITEPALEIEANDVKASHSASSGPPSEEQIFYLSSRGLTREQAINLLATGFLNEVVERIIDTKTRDEVEKKVARFFQSLPQSPDGH